MDFSKMGNVGRFWGSGYAPLRGPPPPGEKRGSHSFFPERMSEISDKIRFSSGPELLIATGGIEIGKLPCLIEEP